MKQDIEYKPSFWYALGISAIFIGFVFVIALLVLIQLRHSSVGTGDSVYLFILLFYILAVVQISRGAIGKKLILIGAATVAAGLLVLVTILFREWSLIIVGAIFFGGGGVFYVWRTLIQRRPVLKANSQSLFLSKGGFKEEYFVVSWSEIKSLFLKNQVAGATTIKYLVVELNDPNDYINKHNIKHLKKLMGTNERMFKGHLSATVSHLDTSEQDILHTLNGFLTKNANQ